MDQKILILWKLMTKGTNIVLYSISKRFKKVSLDHDQFLN